MKESQLISDSREKTSVTSVHSAVGYVMCRQNIKKTWIFHLRTKNKNCVG